MKERTSVPPEQKYEDIISSYETLVREVCGGQGGQGVEEDQFQGVRGVRRAEPGRKPRRLLQNGTVNVMFSCAGPTPRIS